MSQDWLTPRAFIECLLDLLHDLDIPEDAQEQEQFSEVHVSSKPFRHVFGELSEEHRQLIALDWLAFANQLNHPRPTKEALRAAMQPMRFRLRVSASLPIETFEQVDGVPTLLSPESEKQAPSTHATQQELIAEMELIDQSDATSSNKIRQLLAAAGIDERHPIRDDYEKLIEHRSPDTATTAPDAAAPVAIEDADTAPSVPSTAQPVQVSTARNPALRRDLTDVDSIIDSLQSLRRRMSARLDGPQAAQSANDSATARPRPVFVQSGANWTDISRADTEPGQQAERDTADSRAIPLALTDQAASHNATAVPTEPPEDVARSISLRRLGAIGTAVAALAALVVAMLLPKSSQHHQLIRSDSDIQSDHASYSSPLRVNEQDFAICEPGPNAQQPAAAVSTTTATPTPKPVIKPKRRKAAKEQFVSDMDRLLLKAGKDDEQTTYEMTIRKVPAGNEPNADDSVSKSSRMRSRTINIRALVQSDIEVRIEDTLSVVLGVTE